MKGNKFLASVILIAQMLSFGMYFGIDGGAFDKSPNGYGWFYGYNRKVQTNFDPVTGEVIGSLYRRLENGVEEGVTGGMAGEWNTSFYAYSEPIYILSPYTGFPEPGSRFPYICGFINGKSFGIFNHFDVNTGTEYSFPFFTVGESGWGWDMTFWSVPKMVESSDSSSVVPTAWNGTGDVVFDPETGCYYWTQGWKEGLEGFHSPVSCVIGKTKSPEDPDSWIWSDYKDMRFDTDNIVDKYSDVSYIGPMHFAYAKDILGNGSGKGIGVAVTQCYPWYAPQLSYIYTNNWGGDSLSGSWIPNWNKTELGFYHVAVSDLFDWVGETLTLTDSIGYSLDSLEIVSGTGTITIDYARIMWDISVIATEDNIVHVLCMVFPASSEYPSCIFPWTDSGFRAGYYDIRGEITDTGVNWLPAVLIANPIGNNEGWYADYNGMEFTTDYNRTLSIAYAGNNRLMAAWLDKPESREYLFDWINTPKYYNYIDDGYLIVSLDGGNTWIQQKLLPFETGNPDDPVWLLKYAANVTNTSSLFEEGWSLSTHGSSTLGSVFTYAACQYADIAGMVNYMDYARFLKVWDVGYYISGIEPEDVSIAADFELYQNYPNPFNPATEIEFSLTDDSKVNLSVYNTNGQLVKTLVDGKKEKGFHTVNFAGEELNSGMYLYKLDVNGKAQTKKMILLK